MQRKILGIFFAKINKLLYFSELFLVSNRQKIWQHFQLYRHVAFYSTPNSPMTKMVNLW